MDIIILIIMVGVQIKHLKTSRAGWHFTTKTLVKTAGHTVQNILKRKINWIYIDTSYVSFWLSVQDLDTILSIVMLD